MVTDISHKARRSSFSEANALIIDSAIRKAKNAPSRPSAVAESKPREDQLETRLLESHTNCPQAITDPKLIARMRRLINQELAGFFVEQNGRKNVCLEPGCSCNFDTCGPFRDPPVRCTAFEEKVLPLDPELEQAYWGHISQGTVLCIRRCARPGCRREVASVGPNARYCAIHASLQAQEKARKRARRYRASKKSPGVTVLPSAALDNQGSRKASSRSKGETMGRSTELSETLAK